MLNFRKLLHDFSQSVVKEGRHLLEQSRVGEAKVEAIAKDCLKLCYQVEGAFQHTYRGHLDIDLKGSEILYSDCECSKRYDCEHIAAACLYLEAHYDQVLADYASRSEIQPAARQKRDLVDGKVARALRTARENAARKAAEAASQETLEEYRLAQQVLASSAFFDEPLPSEPESAELLLVLNLDEELVRQGYCAVQLVLRIDSRAKPIQVGSLREFFEALEFEEPQVLASRQHWLKYDSFSAYQQKLLRLLSGCVQERLTGEGRLAQLSLDALGALLALARIHCLELRAPWLRSEEPNALVVLENLYVSSLDQPLKLGLQPAHFLIRLHRLDLDEVKVMIEVYVQVAQEQVGVSEAILLGARQPGLIYRNIYYSFDTPVQRRHLKAVPALSDLVVPEPLIGTLLEQGVPLLKRSCLEVQGCQIAGVATLPSEPPKARCEISYAAGKMEVEISFIYKGHSVPGVSSKLSVEDLALFVRPEAVLSRDIWYEKRLVQELFSDFQCDELKGVFTARSDRAIVDFMTRLVPSLRDRVEFICPAKLLDQFVYDTTQFTLKATASSQVDRYRLEVVVEGPLEGIGVAQIWDCLSCERPYVELQEGKRAGSSRRPKVLVLDLQRMRQLARLMDDLGIEQLVSQTYEKPLWTLAHLDSQRVQELPFVVQLDRALEEIQSQLWGKIAFEPQPLPGALRVSLRSYQIEGVHWLEKLRRMHLAGVLADDMGLGKTLQAIVAISQLAQEHPGYCSLVVCPTSLVYNWKEEAMRFNPTLRVTTIDGTPQQRKKVIEGLGNFDLAVTSYSLLQKDIEQYQERPIGYIILDEAQYIKNRQTQNARCVRQLKGLYRLALTGTPVENSLDELWSLFDFLMPGLMSSYDRFVEKYMKRLARQGEDAPPLQQLRRKIAPFVMRRMKSEVLEELPPVSEIVYHCEMRDAQRQLYLSYAESARKELSAMVEREGFDKVRIHILATLTRLKQICCHPAIFTGDIEPVESAKYELFLQIVENLLMAGRKAVIFSQYTKMLGLMRRDLETRGITYCYLDGSTKNRLEMVKRFNEDPQTSLFLISLKAGGTGLNLTGADTVIHYDLWWNPAVESQATDRVHRMGQKARVSCYKLVTLGTIEEKIVELQNRKKGLVRQLVVDDEEAIEKLTWEEVLELLQT